ncbi:MAG: hypothetical protein B6244_08555 [Candidatus Cloacimonetes bacterium 4572_55]|nr:MAG: hypothetical protein B6244_08555 [Candidatus Cloacimonetes bacterium 4572_55]
MDKWLFYESGSVAAEGVDDDHDGEVDDIYYKVDEEQFERAKRENIFAAYIRILDENLESRFISKIEPKAARLVRTIRDYKTFITYFPQSEFVSSIVQQVAENTSTFEEANLFVDLFDEAKYADIIMRNVIPNAHRSELPGLIRTFPNSVEVLNVKREYIDRSQNITEAFNAAQKYPEFKDEAEQIAASFAESIEDYQTYLSAFPEGKNSEIFRTRLVKLRQQRKLKENSLAILLNTPIKFLDICQGFGYQCMDISKFEKIGENIIIKYSMGMWEFEVDLKPNQKFDEARDYSANYSTRISSGLFGSKTEIPESIEFILEDYPHVINSNDSYLDIKCAYLDGMDIIIEFPRNDDALLRMLKGNLKSDALNALTKAIASFY